MSAAQAGAGRSVFITGGGSGIGLAIAEGFVKAGASVGLLGRKPERLQAARAKLAPHLAAGARCTLHAADVREAAAVEAAFAAFVQEHGALHTVVAAAAGNFVVPAASMSSKAFRTVVEIDLLGSFHTFTAARCHLRAGASLIAISAPQSTVPLPGQAHAAAAKAGVDALVRNLALEWGGAGIRVNAIVPGPIEATEGLEKLAFTPAVREAVHRSIPLARFGRGDEVAALALFLAGDGASYITGAVIPCDGGSALTLAGALSPGALSTLLG
jgi:NAD(P)-dependent dehydrogenase (short-subunit alcohol dehydrogenase family)